MPRNKVQKYNKHIKQDINMLEYPLWMPDEKLPSKIPDDKGFIWQDREGYVYRCGYKVPTKLDIIYLMYLLYRSQQEGWREEIELSRYEILKSCGYVSCRPADYERLEDSLERWKMVGVKFKGTFYDGKKYIAISFGVIDTWKIDEESKKLKIRFNKEWLTRIKNSSYFKYLSFDQIRALRSPLAMRLYEILIKSFQNRKEWSIDAKKLAQKIPMKEKSVAHIIPKIKAAVNRINNNSNFKIELTIKRPKRGEAILIFKQLEGEKENYIIEEALKPKKENIEHLKLIEILPKEQQKKKIIRKLIEKALEKYGEEYVRRNILYANEKVRQKRSYRAFLAKALENDWAEGWWEDNLAQNEKIIAKIKENDDLKKELKLREKVEKILKKLPEKEIIRLKEKAQKELPENLREIDSFVRMQMRLILRRKLSQDLPLFGLEMGED